MFRTYPCALRRARLRKFHAVGQCRSPGLRLFRPGGLLRLLVQCPIYSLQKLGSHVWFGQEIDCTLSEDIAAYYVTDLHRTIVDCNDSFLRLFGFSSKSEAVGRPFSSLFPAVSLIDNFLQTLREKKRVLNHEAEYVKQDGTRVYVVENAFAELDRDGNLKTIRGYLLDDTARRKIEGQLYQSQKLENDLDGLSVFPFR